MLYKISLCRHSKHFHLKFKPITPETAHFIPHSPIFIKFLYTDVFWFLQPMRALWRHNADCSIMFLNFQISQSSSWHSFAQTSPAQQRSLSLLLSVIIIFTLILFFEFYSKTNSFTCLPFAQWNYEFKFVPFKNKNFIWSFLVLIVLKSNY